MRLWKTYISLLEESKLNPDNTVVISIVGKYTALPDAYLSVWKSLEIAAVHAKWNLKMNWIEAGDFEENDEHYETLW